MKRYVLCLDESGTFNEKEIQTDSRKCIVGGVLFEDYSLKSKKQVNELYGQWRSTFPKGVSDYLFHAVEMGRKKNSPKYTEIIFDDMHNAGIKFVVFEDDIDAYIIDSNTTYLSLLSEGVVQLIYRLTESTGKPIELGVIIGKRANTGGDKEIYSDNQISDSIYNQKINERIAIERAKCGSIALRESVVHLRIIPDKEDPHMIMADHVCHFWFTRYSKRYIGKSNNEKESIREKLEKYYDPQLIFPFLSNEQDRYVDLMLNNETYADALFEFCLDNLTKRNRNRVIKRVTGISNLALQIQLDNLVNYFKNIIETQRNLELGEKLLKNSDKLISILKKAGRDILKFEIDIKLLLLTVYNHGAKLDKMSSLFRTVDPMVAEYTERTTDINYYLMTRNRYAVYLQDVLEPRESITVCDDAIEVICAVQELIRGLGQTKNNIRKTGNYKSVQLGKLLGTKVQAYVDVVRQDKEMIEEARKVSDHAIKQFSLPADVGRQYQYRAVLEAAAGKYNTALKWIEKYYGMPWNSYLEEKKIDIFGVMNLLHCADFMCDSQDDKVKKKAEKIAYSVRTCVVEKNKLPNEYGYPEICIFYYLGRILMRGGENDWKKYTVNVITHANSNPEFVYQMMALRIRLLLIEDAAAKGLTVSVEKKKFDTLFRHIVKTGLTPSALNEINSIKAQRDDM